MAQPHLLRSGSGANLITNPTVNGQSPWFLVNGATYDSGTTKSADGSGSIKFSALGDAVISGAMTPGLAGTYVLGFYMKANSAPIKISTNLRVPTNVNGGMFSNSAPGIWEECVCTYYLTAAQAANFTVRLSPTNLGDNSVDPTCWIDEVYLGYASASTRLPTFVEPPEVTRVSFTGTRTKIDQYGGWQVRNISTGVFEKFFPIAMHVNYTIPSWWTKYAPLGFNMNAWAETDVHVANGKTGGLRSWYRLAPYINNPAHAYYEDTTRLGNHLAAIKAAGNEDWLIGAYWDDENAATEVQSAELITDFWRANDTETSQRMHPIYALEGQHGMARRLTRLSTDSNEFVDVNGTYANMGVMDAINWGFIDPNQMLGTNGITGLWNAHNQTHPPSIAQMNISGQPAGYFRGSVYSAIIAGAKGVAYFADDLATAGPIEDEDWINEVPQINTETAAAIDIIQTPHWVDGWSISCNLDGDEVRFGAREFNGIKYLIVCNQTSASKSPAFTLTGVPDAIAVRNFFTDAHVTNVISNQFTLSLAALGTNDTQGTYILEIEESTGPPTGTCYYAQVGESIYIDPADVRGPWTVKCPDPSGLADGEWFRVVSKSTDPTNITFDGNGKNIRRVDIGSSVATWEKSLAGDSIHFEYNEGADLWYPILGLDLIDSGGGGTHPVDLANDVTGLLGQAFGGLNANVSAFSGFPYIDANTTIEVDGTGTGDVVRGTGSTINTATITNAAISNATISASFVTGLQIHDTSQDHQYILGVSELAADRTVTLPLLTGNDTFVFEAHTQTLTNKTIAAASNTITMAIADLSDVSGTTGSGNVVRTTSPTISLAILANPRATTLEINDSNSSNQYTIGVADLTTDVTVSLPLLSADTTFAVTGIAQVFSGLQEFNDGINVARASDPGTVTDGMLWYRTDTDVYKGRLNGTIVVLPTISGEADTRIPVSDANGNLICSAELTYDEVFSGLVGELKVDHGTTGRLTLHGGSTESEISSGNSLLTIGTVSAHNVEFLRGGVSIWHYDGDVIQLPVKGTTGDPSGKNDGSIYYNSVDGKFRVKENGTWRDM